MRRDWAVAGHLETMWLMPQWSEADHYVVATAAGTIVCHVHESTFDYWGPNYGDHAMTGHGFFRPAEAEVLVGNPEKTMAEPGWAPETAQEQLVMMMDTDGRRLQAATV